MPEVPVVTTLAKFQMLYIILIYLLSRGGISKIYLPANAKTNSQEYSFNIIFVNLQRGRRNEYQP